jgi:hypothetical protein
MAVMRSGAGSSGSTDPDAMASSAFASAVGDPDVVDAQVKGYLRILLDRDHTPEQVAAAALAHYKKCKPDAKAKIDELFVGADDRKKGKSTTKSKGGDSVPGDVQAKAMALYREGKNPPHNKTGDDLDQWVFEELRKEFGSAHATQVYIAARNNAKEA